MRTGIVLLVLVLNLAAILSILASPARAGRKVAWCTAVVLLPLAGAVTWLLRGRTRTARY